MPSKSPNQKKFMSIAAHDKSFAKKAGIPQSVAKEFNDSDKRYKKPMEKIASIDGYAAYNWCQRKGISYEEFLRDVKLVYLFLGDPENACFKTKNARFKH